MFRFRDLIESHSDELAAIISRSTASSTTTRWAKSRVDSRVVEFACGIPQLLKGEFSRSVGTGRQLVAAPAGRRLSRASRRSISRRWCRCGCFRSRSPAATPSSSSPRRRTRRHRCTGASCCARRAARRRVQRRQRRQGGGRPLLTDPRRRGGELRRLDPDGRSTSTTPANHGKRVQALGGAKNHMVIMPDADHGAGRATR